jgi:hypothetical protein
MRPSTIGDLLAKRSASRPVDEPAPAHRVTHPWWMDPAGLRGSRVPGDRAGHRARPERVPPDP